MAGGATRDELTKAREELARINEKHGFNRNERGPEQPRVAEDPTPVGKSQQLGDDTSKPVDPGPPRFIGIDLDAKLAGLAGGGVIPVDDTGIREIVDILLGQLRVHLARTLGTIAGNHQRPVPSEQLEIPFGENGTPS